MAFEKQELYLFKTTGMWVDSVDLTPMLALENHRNYIETTIFLDLNIISHMRKVMQNEQLFDSKLNLNSGPEPIDLNLMRTQAVMQRFCEKINTLPGVFLSPGGALYEAHEKHKMKNHDGFEFFLKKYLPGFVDAYDCINNLKKNKNFDNFLRFKISYLNILLIHYIDKVFGERSNVDKFRVFLQSLDFYEVPVDGLASLVAIFAFCGRDKLNSDERCFLDNFIKKSNDIERLFANALNAAHDLSYFACAAYVDSLNIRKLSDRKYDAWLMTADRGLYLMSKYIGYLNDGSGVTIVRLELMSEFLASFVGECIMIRNVFASSSKVGVIKKLNDINTQNIIFKKNTIFNIAQLEGYLRDLLCDQKVSNQKM